MGGDLEDAAMNGALGVLGGRLRQGQDDDWPKVAFRDMVLGSSASGKSILPFGNGAHED